MAVLSLQSDHLRFAREAAFSRRVMRWALALSLLIHVAAFTVLSYAHLRPARLPAPSKLIEVNLVEPPAPPAFPSPPALPRPRIAEEPAQRAPATPAPRATARSAAVGRQMAAPSPAREQPIAAASNPSSPPPRVERAAVTRESPAAPSPTPPRAAIPADSDAPPPAPGTQEQPPRRGGGDVGLGAGSRQGDLPTSGGGAGGIPGPRSATGSGTGAGSGTGGSEAGAQSGGGSGPGVVGGSAGAGGGPAGSGPGAGGAGGSGGSSGGYVSRLADRRMPKLVQRVNPVYPMAAQVEGCQGVAKLQVTVTKEGKVGAVRVVTSSGDPRLDAAATNAVKQWRYQPAVQDGIAREVDTYATVTFSLE